MDLAISATRAARSLRAALALSARREEPKEHLFAARGAEATRISLRWAADVLEELEKHGMLIWKGSKGEPNTRRWRSGGAPPLPAAGGAVASRPHFLGWCARTPLYTIPPTTLYPAPAPTRSLPHPALLLPRFVACRPTAVAAAGTAGFAAALSAVTALPIRLCAVGSACAAPTTAPIAVNAVVMTAALLLLRMRWCEIIVFFAQPTASRR